VTVTVLAGATIHTGEAVLDGHVVRLRGDRVEVVVPQDAVGALEGAGAVTDLSGLTLAPGFIDLQVNGGGGVLFNDVTSIGELRRGVEAHTRFGTTSMLPTVITAPFEDTRRVVALAVELMAAGGTAVLGLHLEGPWIEPRKAGAHDPAWIRPADAREVRWVLDHARDPVALVTLAPELDGALPVVRALADAGILVAAGHTLCTRGELRAGEEAGLRGVTHLFNAMSQLGSREPGCVGGALSSPRLGAGIIADGFHVDWDSLRVARAAMGDRLHLVTDAMPPVGLGDVDFRLDGRVISVHGGRCETADGVLAGSALDMATAVRNCVAHAGVPLDEALRMASAYPAGHLGVDDRLGYLRPGYAANLVALDDALQVRRVWRDGRPAFTAP
jgi:N-acetylglucosamine-6-phosphate deacetylase